MRIALAKLQMQPKTEFQLQLMNGFSVSFKLPMLCLVASHQQNCNQIVAECPRFAYNLTLQIVAH